MERQMFTVTCNKCKGENVSIYEDSDYVFDGEDECLIGNGKFVFECRDCGNIEYQ